MLARPNPTRLGKPVEDEDVDKHRRLFCGRYDHCLDEAVASRWAGWTCEHCPLFAAERSIPPALA